MTFVKFVKKKVIKKKPATQETTSSSPPIHKDIESKSPITANSDPTIAEKLLKIEPNIRELNFGQEYEPSLTIWKQNMVDNFTHLHPTEDNLFSPNVATKAPVNGLFISFNSIMNLFSNEKKITITDKLIKLIVDLLHFFKEYSATPNDCTAKQPAKIIFKPKRNKDLLSKLMLLIT